MFTPILLTLLFAYAKSTHFLENNEEWTVVADRKLSRTIVLMAGHIRSFHLIKDSIKKHLIDPYQADVAMCIADLSSDLVGSQEDIYTPTDSWMQEGLVVFREKIPDFSFRDRDDDAFKDSLPLHVDHTCPTGCADVPATPQDLSGALPRIPEFPREHTQSESFRVGMFNQFYAWYACYEMMKKYEQVNNHTYTTIIRHRFDAALWMDYPILTDIPKNTIYIPKGFDYGGVNDRMWISDRSAADVAFSTLLLPFLRAYETSLFCPPHEQALNPESNLFQHLEMHNVTIDRSHPFAWALVDPNTGCARYQDWDKWMWGKTIDYDTYTFPHLKGKCEKIRNWALKH